MDARARPRENPPNMPSSPWRVLANIAIVAASTALSLASADVALDRVQARARRSFYTNLTPSELVKLPDVFTTGTITGTYVDTITDQPWHEPGRSWIWAGQRDRPVEFLVKGRWNNFGCHDDVDYAPSRRSGVLFLGDSFIEAMQLDVRDTFHHRLRHSSFGERYDVWACGAAGWNPTRATLYVDDDPKVDQIPALRQISTLRPKYVMYFVFIGNDLRDQAGPSFEDTLASAAPCTPRQVRSGSVLWSKVHQAADMYLTPGGSDYRCVDNQLWPYIPEHIAAVEDGWNAMDVGLDGLARAVANRGARLIVAMIEPFPVPYGAFAVDQAIRVSFPGGKRVPIDLSLPGGHLRQYAKSRGLEFVNVSDVLRECGGKDHYYPGDEHFSAAGHRCLADYLESHRQALFP